MVRRSSSAKRSPSSFKRKRRSTSAKRSTRRTKRRSNGIGDIHTFKGIINAGILNGLPSATSTHLGGQYIFRLRDLPVYINLGSSFDFVRMNKCRMEFLPRYNMQSAPNTAAGNTQAFNQMFLTGLDEVPITADGASVVTAPSWGSEADDDANVTEAHAYDSAIITPTYIRGMQNSKETEIYKKHVVSFYPVTYNWLVQNRLDVDTNSGGSPNLNNPVYDRRIKTWTNTGFYDQAQGFEVQNKGPDYYGPMYCFAENMPAGSTIQYYDVKLHYSVSFRRLRGS